MNPRHRPHFVFALLAALVAASGCGEGKTRLQVWGADSLSASFAEVAAEFEKAHPNAKVALNIHGSRFIAQVLPNQDADVVALADHRLVQDILQPDGVADWVAKFASNEIVLAGHTSSARRAELTSDNWYEILLKPDITFGIANPDQDPCGYWSQLVWQLAERHYFTSKGQSRPLAKQLADKCPPERIALDANRLISDFLVRARVDYAFIYKTHALDHKLPFTQLPKEINLGHPDHASDYAAAEIAIPGVRGRHQTIKGTYIAFGLTIPKKARHPDLAQHFVRFLLSTQGRDILGRSGFNPIAPARVPKWCAVPPFLADLARPED